MYFLFVSDDEFILPFQRRSWSSFDTCYYWLTKNRPPHHLELTVCQLALLLRRSFPNKRLCFKSCLIGVTRVYFSLLVPLYSVPPNRFLLHVSPAVGCWWHTCSWFNCKLFRSTKVTRLQGTFIFLFCKIWNKSRFFYESRFALSASRMIFIKTGNGKLGESFCLINNHYKI